jgi:hypothetical protein
MQSALVIAQPRLGQSCLYQSSVVQQMMSAAISLNFNLSPTSKNDHLMIMISSNLEAVMRSIDDAGLQEVLLSLKPHLTAPCALWVPSLLEVAGSSAILVPLAPPVHLAPAVLRLV